MNDLDINGDIIDAMKPECFVVNGLRHTGALLDGKVYCIQEFRRNAVNHRATQCNKVGRAGVLGLNYILCGGLNFLSSKLILGRASEQAGQKKLALASLLGGSTPLRRVNWVDFDKFHKNPPVVKSQHPSGEDVDVESTLAALALSLGRARIQEEFDDEDEDPISADPHPAPTSDETSSLLHQVQMMYREKDKKLCSTLNPPVNRGPLSRRTVTTPRKKQVGAVKKARNKDVCADDYIEWEKKELVSGPNESPEAKLYQLRLLERFEIAMNTGAYKKSGSLLAQYLGVTKNIRRDQISVLVGFDGSISPERLKYITFPTGLAKIPALLEETLDLHVARRVGSLLLKDGMQTLVSVVLYGLEW